MAQSSGYKFPILNSNGSVSNTIADFADVFVPRDNWLTTGIWAWGTNGIGTLGVSDVTNRSSPTQVGVLTNWKQVTAGVGTIHAIKTDGTLWNWGGNDYGALGQGPTAITRISSPLQVGLLTNWKNITAGYYFAVGIQNNGTLWGWGYNSQGQIGNQSIVRVSSPVQVGSLTNWKQVSAAEGHVAAVTTDGKLFAWGDNGVNQIDSSGVSYSSPVQIGLLTNWKQVAVGGPGHTMAIKTDGTLWGWGYNPYGEVGWPDASINIVSPVLIGSKTDWKQVSCGTYHTMAIKTDGTLWGWGDNMGNAAALIGGQLGDGTAISKSSPVQIGALSNWKQVDAGADHTVAIKTDGTIWAWGANDNGQLGTGDVVPRSSPVQVGALTIWKQLAAGTSYTAAFQTSDLL